MERRKVLYLLFALYFIYYGVIYDALYLDLGWNLPTFAWLENDPMISKDVVDVGGFIYSWGYVVPATIVLFTYTKREFPVSDVVWLKRFSLLGALLTIGVAFLEKITRRLFIWGVWGSWEAVGLLAIMIYITLDSIEHLNIPRNMLVALIPSLFFSQILLFELPYQCLLVVNKYVPFAFIPYWLVKGAAPWSGVAYVLLFPLLLRSKGYQYKPTRLFVFFGLLFVHQLLIWQAIGFPFHPSWGPWYKPLDGDALACFIEHLCGRCGKITVGFLHVEYLKGLIK